MTILRFIGRVIWLSVLATAWMLALFTLALPIWLTMLAYVTSLAAQAGLWGAATLHDVLSRIIDDLFGIGSRAAKLAQAARRGDDIVLDDPL